MRGLRLLAVLSIGALAACGGGGGGSSGGSVSRGAIANLGSILVAGTEWSTESADVVMDGVAADSDALAPGMFATVDGKRSGDFPTTGSATRVEVDTNLAGPIDSVEPFPGPDVDEVTVEILGVQVEVDRDVTLFAGTGFDFGDLAPDVRICVWGYLAGTAALRATRVEVDCSLPLGSDAVLQGIATGLDTAGSGGTFEIGEVRVVYDDAIFGSPGTDLPGGERALEGEPFLSVMGSLTEGEFRVIDAARFALVQGIGGNPSDVEVEGIVAGFVDLSAPFLVGRQVVGASGFVDLLPPTLAFLRDGTQVVAEGQIDSDGVLIAQNLRLDDPEGRVQGELVRLFELVGARVGIAGETVIEDATVEPAEPLAWQDLMEGDFLNVVGLDLGNRVLATSVLREPSGPDPELEGTLERNPDLEDDAIVLLGVPLLVNGSTDIQDATVMPPESVPLDDLMAGDYLLVVVGVKDGEVVAKSITRLDPQPGARIQGELLAPLDPDGPIDVLGVTLRLDAATRIRDATVDPPVSISAGQLMPGDFLNTAGVDLADEVLATSITREPPVDLVRIRARYQGFTDAAGVRDFTLLGVRIATDASTVFEAFPESVEDEADFYAFLAANASPRLLIEAQRTLAADEAATAIDLADEVLDRD